MTFSRRAIPRRRRLAAAVLLVLVVVAGAGGLYLYRKHHLGDVLHPAARFVPQAPARLAAHDRTRFDWPLYGYDKAHTRFYPANAALHPPYAGRWILHGGALLEFPPVIAGGTIYQLNDNAELVAVNKTSGRVRFRDKLGSLSASTPAIERGYVFVSVLERGRGVHKGKVVAVSQKDGHVVWSRDLPSRSESSPLADRGSIYVGSENGTVYALSADSGAVRWTYHADGAVKASPTLADGRLFFGDYGGHVQAVNEADGRRVWRTSAGSGGNFYSTCAVIYGRVYLGNTDGRVYALDEGSGRLDWAKQTGSYVYSSPAVTNAPGAGPTVFIGSYDGTFYALDAQSGRPRWTYHAGGRISGSPLVLGNFVYFADLGRRETIVLNAPYGYRVWSKHTGSFDPVITDSKWIYLSGYTGLYAYEPQAQRDAELNAARVAAGRRPLPPTGGPRLTRSPPAARRKRAAPRKRATAPPAATPQPTAPGFPFSPFLVQ